ARPVMLVAALTVGVGFIAASRCDSYYPLLAANLMVAIGVTATTLIPAALVIASWFQERRGLAMGLTFAGTSLGGAVMIVAANKAIVFGGWRAGYVAMALPMLAVVAPLVLFVVRSRPLEASDSPELTRTRPGPVAVPGVELTEAFRTRSFWLIAIAEFFYACAIGGILVHLVVYLIGTGYTATLSASSLSMIYLQQPQHDLSDVDGGETCAGSLRGSPQSSGRALARLRRSGSRHDTSARGAERIDAGGIHRAGGDRSWHAAGAAPASFHPVLGAQTFGLGAGSCGNICHYRRRDRPCGGRTDLRRERQLRHRFLRVCGDVAGSGACDIRVYSVGAGDRPTTSSDDVIMGPEKDVGDARQLSDRA